MINQDEDMKISFKCNAAHQLLLGLSLNNIAPNMIWMCLFTDNLSLNTIFLTSLIHHLIIFHCPLVDLNTTCFPSRGQPYCPKVSQLFKECWEMLMSFLSKILQTRSMFFLFDNLVLESTPIFQRSCLFKV
jgi:hypothetical protein